MCGAQLEGYETAMRRSQVPFKAGGRYRPEPPKRLLSVADWISLLSVVLSAAAILGTVYTVNQTVQTRQQDHEIQHLQGMELKLYDAEIADGERLCLYPEIARSNAFCSDDKRKATDKNLAYIHLTADFAKAIREYNAKWCGGNEDPYRTSDCDLYGEFLIDFDTGPAKLLSPPTASQ